VLPGFPRRIFIDNNVPFVVTDGHLSEPGPDNLGLACNEDGLVLGRTPLIERRDGRFVVRDADEIQRLLSLAYRTQVDASSLMGGLTTVAAALNANVGADRRGASAHS
jgi:hypothetical protein